LGFRIEYEYENENEWSERGRPPVTVAEPLPGRRGPSLHEGGGRGRSSDEDLLSVLPALADVEDDDDDDADEGQGAEDPPDDGARRRSRSDLLLV